MHFRTRRNSAILATVLLVVTLALTSLAAPIPKPRTDRFGQGPGRKYPQGRPGMPPQMSSADSTVAVPPASYPVPGSSAPTPPIPTDTPDQPGQAPGSAIPPEGTTTPPDETPAPPDGIPTPPAPPGGTPTTSDGMPSTPSDPAGTDVPPGGTQSPPVGTSTTPESSSGAPQSTGAPGGQQYSGDGTFYTPGLGACGITNGEGDYIAAVSHAFFDSFPGATANPNNNPICGRKVRATYQGKSVEVAITDRCGGCEAPSDLDFTQLAFTKLASPDVGRIHGMTWEFI